MMNDTHPVTYTIIQLPPSNRGRNKRGLCSHKPTKGAKRARKQKPPVIGLSPNLQRNSVWHPVPRHIYR